MYSEEELADLIINYVNNKLDSELNQIDENTNLIEFGGLDSIFIVEMSVYIEELVDITLPDSFYELDNFTSVKTIVNVIVDVINGTNKQYV